MAFVEFEKVSKIYHTGAVEIPGAAGRHLSGGEGGDLRHCRGLRCRKDHAAEYFGGDGYPHRRHGEAGWPGYLPLRPAGS